MQFKIIGIILPVFIFLFLLPNSIRAATYYVAPNGDNANSGTITSPWKTLVHSSSRLRAGDTLLIRSGTYYNDRIYIGSNVSGTQDNPLRVSAYNNEEVILDGNNSTPPHDSGSALVQISGNWIIIENLTVTRSGNMGLSSSGLHNTFNNIYVHHNWGWGIVMSGNYNLAQYSRAWSNSMLNENHSLNISWAGGITCARYPDYCTISNCTSWDNWGEGISTFESMHATIEDNVSYNNMQNFYISDTKFTTLRRNLSYCTPENANDNDVTQNGILVGDELGVPNPLPNGNRETSSNNTFVNNFVIGCNRNLAASPGKASLQPGLGNNLYAYNTFINAAGSTPEMASVLFYSGPCSGCKFINNIIVQSDKNPIVINESTGYILSNNLWSKMPPSALFNQTTDIIADPLVANPGIPAPGLVSDDWFKLTSSSPAINKGVVVTEIIDDHFKNNRDNSPDIGGHEYLQENHVPADANGDGRVDGVDYVIWLTHYNQNTSNGFADGDFNTDGIVNGEDYVIWLNHYGQNT